MKSDFGDNQMYLTRVLTFFPLKLRTTVSGKSEKARKTINMCEIYYSNMDTRE